LSTSREEKKLGSKVKENKYVVIFN